MRVMQPPAVFDSIRVVFSHLSRLNYSQITKTCKTGVNILQYIINADKSFSGIARCDDGTDQPKMAHVHFAKTAPGGFYFTGLRGDVSRLRDGKAFA